jgi:hypothetical protein
VRRSYREQNKKEGVDMTEAQGEAIIELLQSIQEMSVWSAAIGYVLLGALLGAAGVIIVGVFLRDV